MRCASSSIRARRSRSWTNIDLADSGVPSYCACAPRAVRSKSATVTFWLPTVMIGLFLDEQPKSASDSDAAASASVAGRDTGLSLLGYGPIRSPRRLGGGVRDRQAPPRALPRALARSSCLLHHRRRHST